MAFTFRWVSTPGQNNSFVNGSINSGRARAFLDDGKVDPFDSPLYICVPPITFAGGNGSAATLYDFARTLATCGVYSTVANPGTNYNGNKIPTGGTLTVNGNSCGNYEYNVLSGGTTLNQATVATLFSSTLDISTWIVVQGDLTIPASVVLIPNVNPSYSAPATTTSPDPYAKRRLFMVVYVTGNLSIGDSSSAISMTGCGGNTSATGANIGTFNVPIASNIYYFSTPNVSPTIQSVGGAGGAAVTSANGNSGDNAPVSVDGSALYTGGGGSGNQTAGANYSGAGGSGSAFSGGTGGGSATKNTGATDGSSLGGVGGTGSGGASSVGGTGNPGGTGGAASGSTGTGGVLVVICEGTISSGGGKLRANGINSVISGGQEGGASGGGIVAVIKSSSTSFTDVEVAGGNRSSYGGPGGIGSSYTYGINS